MTELTYASLDYEPDVPSRPLLEHQLKLEELFNKNQIISRVKQEFLDFQDGMLLDYMKQHDINEELGLDLLVQMVLHKRTTMSTIVGILRRHYVGPDASQLACNEVAKCIQAQLVFWNSSTKQLIVKINISDDVQADIDRFQFPLPMVIRPRKVEDNRDTGYLLTRNSIILRKNHHEDDVCLDHINRVNRIRFCINFDTANMIANRWRNLDKPKQGETKADFDKRVKAFDKYDRTAREVMDLLLKHGNLFYLTHKYDKRGRVYCQGYHVNYQGAPWNKAVIELADKEIVP